MADIFLKEKELYLSRDLRYADKIWYAKPQVKLRDSGRHLEN